MKILIITPNYSPDLGPSAPLFTMLSNGLCKLGHKVTVITAVPHYPTGHVPTEFRGRWIQKYIENGVDVFRVNLPSLDRKNLSKRMLQFISYQIGATLASFKQGCDVAFVANPALQDWLPFTWLAVFKKKPIVFSVHDVYPDVGINLGIFKNKFAIAFVSALERFCLNHATLVRILSPSFQSSLTKSGVPVSKIRLIYDWVDTDLISPLSHDNLFSQQYGLNSRFIVLYAGNLGLSQGLEHILSVAKLLIDHEDILFVFVGNGSGKEILQTQMEQQHLSNVKFIAFQPREDLPNVLASADISLVILKKGIGADSLPSKTYSIMASGRPILCSVDENSETWKLLKKADAGIWVPPEDPKKLADAIIALKDDQDLRERLGNNGRSWVENNRSPNLAAEKIVKLLNEAIQIHNKSS